MSINFKTPIAPALNVKRREGPLVGIELEYEDCSHHQDLSGMYDFWHVDVDHSLRNGGLEFISKPLREIDLTPALQKVQVAIEKVQGSVNKRCGVHIHLNVSDLTFGEVWKVCTLYSIVEPMIFKEFADGREENHFCVPSFSNTVLQQYFYEDAISLYKGLNKRKKYPAGYLTDAVIAPKSLVPLRILALPKYAAMNTSALCKYGTLEFRQMRGTRDMAKVRKWARFLIRLRETALQYKDMDDILLEYEDKGLVELYGKLGLRGTEQPYVEDVTDAVDGAYIMVGHRPTKIEDLEWEIS